MLSKWPIRNKLLVGLALVLVIVGVLSWGGIHGLYAYRNLVKSLSRRADELPLSHLISLHVSNLRVAVADTRSLRDLAETGGNTPLSIQPARDEFEVNLTSVEASVARYRNQLGAPSELTGQIVDQEGERKTVDEIEKSLARVRALQRDEDWMLDEAKADRVAAELSQLQSLTAQLPTFMQNNIREFTEEARTQYRTLLVLTWFTTLVTVVMMALFVQLFYQWIFRPLRTLVKGSRKVASGQFGYRIRINTNDEMAELAAAMNQMTERFQSIRDDLDRQVQERTKQVVRNEQLASVGFLAAGVAHEINNPLASIAMCAESLESRIGEIVTEDSPDHAVVRNYLRMIQNEAFRCKGITEKLLDFSRTGEIRRQATDLRELVTGVTEMIAHLGKYQGKNVELAPGEPVLALVNPQEIKQVVLNLVTNALDSVDQGGTVSIEIGGGSDQAEIIITDDGCGMTDEVREHLFEPFFTRRRNGQGTGLGLSIVYRIVSDHEGTIEAHSDGPGCGSQFRVCLPLALTDKENHHRYQAA